MEYSLLHGVKSRMNMQNGDPNLILYLFGLDGISAPQRSQYSLTIVTSYITR